MLEKDKVQHFVGGVVIAAAVGAVVDPLAGLLAAAGVGAAKELVWDKMMGRGVYDLMDFVATAAGGVIGTLVVTAIGGIYG